MVGLDPLLIYVACCSFGVLVGALLTGFGLQLRHARKKHRLEQSQLELREQMKHLDHSRQDAKNEVLQLREDLGKSQDSLSSIQTRAAGFESTIKALESQIAGAQEKALQAEERYQRTQVQLGEARENLAKMEAAQVAMKSHHEEKMRLMDEAKNHMKQEFENLANQIFEAKNQDFQSRNSEKLGAVLNPLKEQLHQFRQRIDQVHQSDVQERAVLKTELKNLQDLNNQMTQEAQNLTTALKGQKKLQGNWGEMILGAVLETAGLRKGLEYSVEQVKQGEEGNTLRPDVVVNLPEGRHIVIDSKVSLNDYSESINEKDEDLRKDALDRHVGAIRNHIKTLSKKRYHKLKGINSPELVFMFVPIESALMLAFQHDHKLAQEALKQNIFVTAPTTLVASLQIVANLWSYERRSKNSQKLADKASRVYEKLRIYLESMEQLGKQLHKAQGTYNKALEQLTTGQGNLVKQAMDFKDLGVSLGKALPQSITDRATLEIASLGAAKREGAYAESLGEPPPA